MSDTYTPSLRIVQMPTGSNDGLWGDKADTALRLLEVGIAGRTSISLTASNHTLTTANNADDEARNMVIVFTGTPGVTRTVTMSDEPKITIVENDTDSSIIFTAGAGTTVTVKTGQKCMLGTDGATNVESLFLTDIVAAASTLGLLFRHESM